LNVIIATRKILKQFKNKEKAFKKTSRAITKDGEPALSRFLKSPFFVALAII
jgi:wyosine [tRNA(Phe)-imidazoG37] synthetase (radical SAM superfamily)